MNQADDSISWMYKCDGNSILLLEGRSDCNIIDKFRQDNNIEENLFNFCNCENDNQVLKKIESLLKTAPEIRPARIGVILDADSNIETRYDELKRKLKNYPYSLPTKFPETGLITESENYPKLGVWIMPNNKDNGALEQFYLPLATDIDTDFIEKYINTAQQKNLTSFKPQDLHKAIMHTYFAWQDKPSDPLHSAITNIVLNYDHKIAQLFKQWLINLFTQ